MMRTVAAAALFAVASAAAADEAKLDKVNHELNLELKVMAENWVKSVAQKQPLTAKGNSNRYSIFAEDMYKMRAIAEKLPEMKKDRDAREAKLKEFYEVAVPQVLKDAQKDVLKLQTKTTTSKAKAPKGKGKSKEATPTEANSHARANAEAFFKTMELVKTYEGFRNFANWMDWERNPELKLEVLAGLKFADLYPLYELEHGTTDNAAAKKFAYDLLDFLGHAGKIDGTLDDTDKTYKAPEKKITFEEMRARVAFMKNTYLPEAAAVNEKEAKAMRKEMNALWKVWGEKNGAKGEKKAVHANAVQAIKNDADKVNIYNLMRNNPFRLEGDTTTGSATPTEKDCKDGKCGHDHGKDGKKDGEQEEPKDTGMSGCAIGMIVVGVLAVLALGGLAVSMLCCKADEDALDSV